MFQKKNGSIDQFSDPRACTISFKKLINQYAHIQNSVQSMVSKIASSISQATPGRFLLVQFAMAQVTQYGDTISNLISQVNSMISNSIRNQKTS
jgi:hypothetical protein